MYTAEREFFIPDNFTELSKERGKMGQLLYKVHNFTNGQNKSLAKAEILKAEILNAKVTLSQNAALRAF